MIRPEPTRVGLPLAFLIGLISSLVGCGGGDSDTTGPDVPSGSLTVTVSTSGSTLDPDGYTVLVDGLGRGTLTGTSPVTVSGLTPGNHAVGLDNVASNCQIVGDNPRVVPISSGATASVEFTVVCSPSPAAPGSIRVVVTTSGPDPDPDGYLAILDGAGPGIAVPATGSATLPDVTAGSHTVTLTGLASNCTASEGGSATTTVSSGAASEVSFTVTCTALPPTAGAIRISTSTTGPDPDTDGYQFAIDGGAAQSIASNGQVTVNQVPAGTHTVVLSSVAANCRVDDASKSVTVSLAATVTVTFAITCTALPPTAGAIRVTTTTSGADRDPDGYTFSIDGGLAQAIGTNSSQTVNDIPAGAHTVVLSGVAENCSVAGETSRNVSVTGGQTANVAFSLECSATGPSASRSTMLADPKNIATGASSTITVTVRDASGGMLMGVPVTLSSSGSGNAITPESATTNASGVATFTFSSVVAGNKTITATAGGITLEDTEVITVFRHVSSTEITSVEPEPSESGETITVTVTVTGEGGATPTGTVAVFSLQEAGGCEAAPLNGQGIAVCEFPLNEVDIHTIGASYSGDNQFEDSIDADGWPHQVTEPEGGSVSAR